MAIELRNKAGELVAMALVSECDFVRVKKAGPWHVSEGYAANGDLRLHNFVMGPVPQGSAVWDHADQDRLNNTRENLRAATSRQNAHSRRKREGTTSRYIGVSRSKNGKAWQAQLDGRGFGTFTVEIEAAKARDRAALFLFREFAALNGVLSEEEVQAALAATELSTSIAKVSELGRGISRNGENYYVLITDDGVKYTGSFNTHRAAVQYRDQLLVEKEERRLVALEAHYALPIERNPDGVPIVPLRNKKGTVIAHALVDELMWHDIMRYRWCRDSVGYASTKVAGEPVRMHAYVFYRHFGILPPKHIIDHIKDYEDAALKKLDNRSANLRAATRRVNAHNRAVAASANSKYLGVHRRTDKSLTSIRWRAQINLPDGKRRSLGTFDTEVQAARAYNVAALELYGEFARLNVIEA